MSKTDSSYTERVFLCDWKTPEYKSTLKYTGMSSSELDSVRSSVSRYIIKRVVLYTFIASVLTYYLADFSIPYYLVLVLLIAFIGFTYVDVCLCCGKITGDCTHSPADIGAVYRSRIKTRERKEFEEFKVVRAKYPYRDLHGTRRCAGGSGGYPNQDDEQFSLEYGPESNYVPWWSQ